jgi:hypothetical protein
MNYYYFYFCRVLEVLTVLAVIVAGKELACNGHDGEETIGLLQINNGTKLYYKVGYE